MSWENIDVIHVALLPPLLRLPTSEIHNGLPVSGRSLLMVVRKSDRKDCQWVKTPSCQRAPQL